MRNPYIVYEQLQEFSKRIGIDIRKLENEMIKFKCRNVCYDPLNDEVVLMIPDGNGIYIKRKDLLKEVSNNEIH